MCHSSIQIQILFQLLSVRSMWRAGHLHYLVIIAICQRPALELRSMTYRRHTVIGIQCCVGRNSFGESLWRGTASTLEWIRHLLSTDLVRGQSSMAYVPVIHIWAVICPGMRTVPILARSLVTTQSMRCNT